MQEYIQKCYELSKAELCDENTRVFSNLKDMIWPWLNSAEFSQNYANAPYPPLLNPASIDYATSEPKLCWILNIPLPKVFDFFIFGSHGVSLESAVPAFLMLCDCKCVARDGEKNSEFMYISYFERLIKAALDKQNGKCKIVALLIADFIQDALNDKLYALVPRTKALHIVRDPVTNLKTLCNLEQQIGDNGSSDDDFSDISSEYNEQVEKIKRKGRKKLAYKLNQDPRKQSANLISYRVRIGDDARDSKPSANAVEFWIREVYQSFHDGMLRRALINIKDEDILIKQTSDLIGAKSAMASMSELARCFGFNEPKASDEWLFNMRVSDYKALLPAAVLASANEELYSNLTGGGENPQLKCKEHP